MLSILYAFSLLVLRYAGAYSLMPSSPRKLGLNVLDLGRVGDFDVYQFKLPESKLNLSVMNLVTINYNVISDCDFLMIRSRRYLSQLLYFFFKFHRLMT